MHINYEKYRSVQMAYQVGQKLICLKYSNQSEDYIRQALQNLQESYKKDKLNWSLSHTKTLTLSEHCYWENSL